MRDDNLNWIKSTLALNRFMVAMSMLRIIQDRIYANNSYVAIMKLDHRNYRYGSSRASGKENSRS